MVFGLFVDVRMTKYEDRNDFKRLLLRIGIEPLAHMVECKIKCKMIQTLLRLG
jgi:hypothetical protein